MRTLMDRDKKAHDKQAHDVADEIKAAAAADAEIGERQTLATTQVAGGIETKEQRAAREASEDAQAKRLNQLGRIEEVRASLARHAENYAQTVHQALQRLQGMVGGNADPEVQRAAKAVADAYDLKLAPGGLKQPPTPTHRNPFDDGK